VKNLHGFAHGNISEALQKHLDLDFLHGNNFFHLKQLKYIARGLRDLRTAPFSLFIGKRGRRLPPNSPRRAGLLPPEAI